MEDPTRPKHRLERDLQALKEQPARDVQAARTGRKAFLAEARLIRREIRQQSGWRAAIQNFIDGRLSPRLAFSPVMAVLLAAFLLLGSAGTTVFAAQGSLPDSPFYGLKLWTENVRLQSAGSAQVRLQLDQEFADRRVNEIVQMAGAGKSAGESVGLSLQNLLDDAMQNAARLDDAGQAKALEALKNNLARHQAQLAKLSQQANAHALAEYTRLVATLDLRLQLAEEGIKSPQTVHDWAEGLKSNIPVTGEAPNPQNQPTPNSGKNPEKTVTPAANGNNGNGNGPQNAKDTPHPTQVEKTPGSEGKGKGNNP